MDQSQQNQKIKPKLESINVKEFIRNNKDNLQCSLNEIIQGNQGQELVEFYKSLWVCLFENLEECISNQNTEELKEIQDQIQEILILMQMSLSRKELSDKEGANVVTDNLLGLETRLVQKNRKQNLFQNEGVKEKCVLSVIQLYLRYYQFFEQSEAIDQIWLQNFQENVEFCEYFLVQIVWSFNIWKGFWPHKLVQQGISLIQKWGKQIYQQGDEAEQIFIQFLEDYSDIYLAKQYNAHLCIDLMKFIKELVQIGSEKLKEKVIQCVFKCLMLCENQKSEQIQDIGKGIEWFQENFNSVITYNLGFENIFILEKLVETTEDGQKKTILDKIGHHYLQELRVSHEIMKKNNSEKNVIICVSLSAALGYLCSFYCEFLGGNQIEFLEKCMKFEDQKEKTTVLENICRKIKEVCFMNEFFLFTFNSKNQKLYQVFQQIVNDPKKNILNSIILTYQICIFSGQCQKVIDQMCQKISVYLQKDEEMINLMMVSEMQFILNILSNEKPLIQSSIQKNQNQEIKKNYIQKFLINFIQLYENQANLQIITQNLDKFIAIQQQDVQQQIEIVCENNQTPFQLKNIFQNQYFFSVFTGRFEYQNPLREISIEKQQQTHQWNQNEVNTKPENQSPSQNSFLNQIQENFFKSIGFNMMLDQVFFTNEKIFQNNFTFINFFVQNGINVLNNFLDSTLETFDEIKFTSFKSLINNLIFDQKLIELLTNSNNSIPQPSSSHLISIINKTKEKLKNYLLLVADQI